MADAVELYCAPNVLWLADGDTGHGNALAVQKFIRADQPGTHPIAATRHYLQPRLAPKTHEGVAS